jgi:soluble lytic murein transglycosylase
VKLVTALRFVLIVAAALALPTALAAAKPNKEVVPLPRPRPAALKFEKIRSTAASQPTHARAVDAPAGPAESSSASFTPASGTPSRRRAAVREAMDQSEPALAMAASASTTPLDIAAVKEAVELTRKGRHGEATAVENTISDPVARKLTEWVILHSEDGDIDFSRYAAFIAANPSWPGVRGLRRRAEGALWEQHTEPRAVIAFFAHDPPLTAKGQFSLARALLATGDTAGARAAVREAWHNDDFSAELEEQARAVFADVITPGDDKIRMDRRLYAEDEEAAMRAAHHLDPVALAIAKARVAVINQSSKAKALLEEVPAAARHDPGYMFSRIQWLRRQDKITEAAQWMLAAPRDPDQVGDPDEWWVERRLVARKLIDLGDFKAAYDVARTAAVPSTENHRAEQQFTAGWIALRFLREPSLALAHFARIADGVVNPITLARAFYWQGRAAEALGRGHEARGYYETAARYPTAYYGQLARARLGFDTVALRQVPDPPTEDRRLEVVRAFEILYAIDERDLVANMAADLADRTTDTAALAMLAEITARHRDARATLLIGKIALRHGLPLESFAFPDFGVPEYQQIGPPVERSVVYSIVRQESAFNPRVVSSANAIGLMQVTPAAGRDTARRFNVAFDKRRLMSDIAYNAQLGTAELGNDIAAWRGSYILAFVAYNAGPRRAKEWIDEYGDPRSPKVDPIDWIERIPLAETRNYVQRVIENMQVYRARLGNDSRLLIEVDLHRGG